jgi:hypothetical protein
MNRDINKKPAVLENIGNNMDQNTVFSSYSTPMEFKNACEQHCGNTKKSKEHLDQGIEAWNNFQWDSSLERIYKDVHEKVRDKLISRGFTSKMLYGTPEFTSEKTGILCKQRALLGMRD